MPTDTTQPEEEPFLLDPNELPDMMEDPAFGELPFADRKQAVEISLQGAHNWMQKNGGWTRESWRDFGEVAGIMRGKVAESETAMEWAGAAAGTVGSVIKDSAATVGATALGLSPVLPTKDGGLTWQVPAETTGPAFGLQLMKGVEAGRQLLNAEERQGLELGMGEIRRQIDEGEFLDDESGVEGWLEKRAEAVRETQREWYGDADGAESWAEKNHLLGDPDNAGLLATYMKTRDPAAWSALEERIYRTPQQARNASDEEALSTETKLGQALKPEAQGYIMESVDPFEQLGNFAAVLKGIKAASKGASLGRRAAEFGKGVAGEVLSEQGSLTLDNPLADFETRKAVAKETLIGALGLAGMGAAAKLATRAPEALDMRTSGMAQKAAEIVKARMPSTQQTQPAVDTAAATNTVPNNEQPDTSFAETLDDIRADRSAVTGERQDPAANGASGRLVRSATERGRIIPESQLEAWKPGKGGNEHDVFTDLANPGVIYKVTLPNLGLRVGATTQPRRFEKYLERWKLANEAFGQHARLSGVIDTPQGPRLVIEQTFRQAADVDAPHPKDRQVNEWLTAAGFEYQSGAWVRAEDGLVLEDEHDGNWIATAEGLRPVDLVLTRLKDATGPVLPWEETLRRVSAAGLESTPIAADAAILPVEQGKPSKLAQKKPPQVTTQPESGGGPGASSLKEWGKTTFGQRLKGDERLRKSWRDKVGGQYRIESEAEWQARANGFIEDNGLEGAFVLLMDSESGLSPTDQVALGLQLILSLDAEIKLAEQTGDTARAELLDDLLHETAEHVEMLGTKMGQGVRVFGMWTRMSAEGVLRAFERKVNQAREADMEVKLGGKPEDIAAQVDEIAKEETADVTSEALGESSSEQLTELQRQVDALRQQLAEATAAATAAQQETAQAPTPAAAAQAEKRAQSAEKTRQKKQRKLKQMEARQEKKATQAGKPRPKSERKPRVTNPEELAWRWIDKMMQKHVYGGPTPEQKVGALAQLIRDYLKADAAALPDFNALARALGLPPPEAVELQRMLDLERKHIAEIARERAITRLVTQLTPKLSTKTRSQVPRFLAKLFDAYELGALDRPEFLKAYAEAFDMPVMDAAMRKKITELIEAQRNAPDGYLKQHATTKLMGELAMFKGIKAMDIGYAFWYANMLSGFGTQTVNVWGNALNLAVRVLTVGFSHNPSETKQFLIGMMEGAARGLNEAKHALKEGGVSYRGDLNFTDGQVLELIYSDNPQTWRDRFKNGLALGRFVFRALSAGDSFFYHTNREATAFLEAARYARQQEKLGNSGSFAEFMAQQLNNTPEMWAAAVAQAETEIKAQNRPGYGFGEVDRRAWEILEAKRPPELVSISNRFGDLGTYNYEPEGTFGQVALATKAIVNSIRFETRIGTFRPLQLLIPFVNIICNTTSRAFDLTPIGILRGTLGHPITMAKGLREGQQYNKYHPREAHDRLAAGILGTSLGCVIGGLALANRESDDDEAPFMIYGMGPPDKNKRGQMPLGWKPFTIKIGDRYWSYSETPFAYLFGVIGNSMDTLRYTNTADTTALEAMTLALLKAPEVATKTGAFSGINELIKWMRGEVKIQDAVSRPLSGLIPAQGLLRDVNKLFGVPKLDPVSIGGAIFKDVPFVGGLLNKPALNIFGETIPMGWVGVSRITDGQGQDPEVLWLRRENLWLPGMDDKVDVAQWLTKSEKATARGARWREGRVAETGAKVAGVLTPEERYKLVEIAGPLTRQAVKEARKIKAENPSMTSEHLQSRLNAKVETARKTAMRKVLGL